VLTLDLFYFCFHSRQLAFIIWFGLALVLIIWLSAFLVQVLRYTKSSARNELDDAAAISANQLDSRGSVCASALKIFVDGLAKMVTKQLRPLFFDFGNEAVVFQKSAAPQVEPTFPAFFYVEFNNFCKIPPGANEIRLPN